MKAHAVELAGLLLEAPDQQHLAIGFKLALMHSCFDLQDLILLDFCRLTEFRLIL
jgi:hypothetical protein